MKIVFVHGIWDTGRVFRNMAGYLGQAGHDCYTPDLAPANGGHGLEDLSLKLKNYIEKELGTERFALVGFSMGCMVCRHYLQRRGGLERATHFFCISGPNLGTADAHVWPGKAARDMRFWSPFLRDLNADVSSLNQIEVRTYRTPFDLLIIPSRSSKLPGAVNRVVCAPLHHRMLCQESILEDIASTLAIPGTDRR